MSKVILTGKGGEVSVHHMLVHVISGSMINFYLIYHNVKLLNCNPVACRFGQVQARMKIISLTFYAYKTNGNYLCHFLKRVKYISIFLV